MARRRGSGGDRLRERVEELEGLLVAKQSQLDGYVQSMGAVISLLAGISADLGTAQRVLAHSLLGGLVKPALDGVLSGQSVVEAVSGLPSVGGLAEDSGVAVSAEGSGEVAPSSGEREMDELELPDDAPEYDAAAATADAEFDDDDLPPEGVTQI